jgi:hypothetical protein
MHRQRCPLSMPTLPLRLRLGWHLRRCGDCREVERQLALIDALAGEWLGGAQR